MASPPDDDALPRRPRMSRTWLGFLVFIGTALGSLGCMCGHYSVENAFFLIPTTLFAWFWCLHGSLLLRALLSSVAAFSIGKTVVDVLWNGHDPLLTKASRPDFLLVGPGLSVGGTVLLIFVGTLVAARRSRLRAAQSGGGTPMP